ncbi:MAG: methionine--tRNA ligase [Turneriella sp.]|nr:methionine--tRNA ligase [Turneriella sp.]
MNTRVMITTPIYYVNARPHIGHAYTTIACDTWARYQRLSGRNVFFLTGTDEHGDKIAKAAAAEGKSPQEYCDSIAAEFRAAWQKLGLTPDDFIRTTEERHQKVVKFVLQKIYEAGDIYAGDYTGKYCFGCERYLTEKELNEKGECATHLTVPQLISEKNYFFRMQKYLPRWKELLLEDRTRIVPESYTNEVLGTIDELIKNGEDLSISRPKSRLSWGIGIPFDNDYVTYVWFDALINYLTAIGYPEPSFMAFWENCHHMIAKDILKPHAVYWPTMLLALGVPIYKRLVVHGYWLGFADQKMSKSLGNAKDPLELAGKIGNDALRFFLMREMHFGSDARFSEEIMFHRLNSNLANDLGNLIQRTLAMLKKYGFGPEPGHALHPVAENIDTELNKLHQEYTRAFENFAFHDAIEAVFVLIRNLNRTIEEHKPWQLAKENPAQCAALLNTLLRAIVAVLLYLRPVLPEKTAEFLHLLQAESKEEFPKSLATVAFKTHRLESWPVFFQRLEAS